MRRSDRLQALIRNPEYLEALQQIKGRFNHEARSTLLKKFNLNDFFPNREFVEKYGLERLEIIPIFTDELPVKLIPAGKTKLPKVPSDADVSFRWDAESLLREERFLTIEVDLAEKDEIITDKFKNLLSFFKKVRKNRGAEIKRDRKKTSIDPWEVYDLHHQDGLNFAQIARKLSKLHGNPTYNQELKRHYDAVRRAYKKAEEMIAKAQR